MKTICISTGGNFVDRYVVGENGVTTYLVETDEFGCPVKVTVYKNGKTITYRGTFSIREDS